MAVDGTRSRIGSVQREITSLQKRLADVTGKQARTLSDISRTQSAISRTSSASSLKSKLRDIERLQRDVAKHEEEKARISRDISRKTEDLHRQQTALGREQEREQTRTMAKLEASLRRAQDESARAALYTAPHAPSRADEDYDAFISHATEDKVEIARPLADALIARGRKVWYDEFALRVGDSLRRSIDKGLARSRFGIVVLSPSFFEKNWPQYELDGLVAKEIVGGKVVLPLWHKVSKDEVLKFSPTLADRVALHTATMTVDEIAEKLSEAMNAVT